MAFYKKLATLFMACLTNISVAHTQPTSIFPHGCEAIGFVFYRDHLVLNEHGKQTIYFIQNRSRQSIELEHIETKTDAFMSPKLEAKINPGQWSAFASDVAELYFRCYIQQNEERVARNCADFLNVCQYPRARFALSNQGSYWASKDKTLAQVIAEVSSSAKGIYLHW